MADVQSFISRFWHDFQDASLPDQFGYAVTIGSVLLAIVVTFASLMRWRSLGARFKTAQAMIDDLSREKHDLLATLADRDARLKQVDPASWISAAETHAQAGNHQSAANALRLGVENVRADLATVTFALADFHVQRSALFPKELGEASALAQIAAVMGGGQRVAWMVQEINELKAATTDPLERYSDDPHWSTWPFEESAETALVQVDVLAKRAEQLHGIGQFHAARRLAETAVKIAGTAKITSSRPACHAMHQLAETLYEFAQYGVALDLAERVISTPDVRGQEKNLAHAKALRGRILWRTDRFAEALVALREAVPEVDRECSARCGLRCEAHIALAQTLSDLGQNQEALAEIDLLIASRVQPDVGEDPRRLRAIVQRAQILGRLSRHEEALSEMDNVRPRLIALLGSSAPNVHWLEHLRAWELWNLGRHDEARNANDDAVEGMTKAVGERHPDTKSFKYLQEQWAA